jgi:DNA repair exonuclease SbcCD ATPase subunit
MPTNGPTSSPASASASARPPLRTTTPASKRQLEARSRGSSPSDKRPRTTEQGARPTPRLSALDTNIRENRTNHVANRRMDVQQSDRRGSHGQSPLQSPGGSASEASTPIHPAPPVPNMVPTAVSAATPPFNTEGMTTLAALRKVQLKKINSRTSQSTDLGPLTDQLKATTDQLKDMQEQLKDTRKQLSDTQAKLDTEHQANIHLGERVKALERLPSRLEEFVARVDKDQSSSRLEELRVRVDKDLATVNRIYENEHITIEKLVKDVDSLNNSMTKLQEQDLHAQINDIRLRGNNHATHARLLENSISKVETNQSGFDDQVSKLRNRIVDVEKDRHSMASQQESEKKEQVTRAKYLQGRIDGLELSFKKTAETNQNTSDATPQQLESIEKEIKVLKSTFESNQSIIAQVPQIQKQLNKEVQKLESSIQNQQPLIAQIVPVQKQMQTIITDVQKLKLSTQSSQHDTQKQLDGSNELSKKITAVINQATELDYGLKLLNSQVTSLATAADIKDLRAQLSQLADKLSKLEGFNTAADINNMQLQLVQHAKQISNFASLDTATDIKEIRTQLSQHAEKFSKIASLDATVDIKDMREKLSQHAEKISKLASLGVPTHGELLQPTQSDSQDQSHQVSKLGERVKTLEDYLVKLDTDLNELIAWRKWFLEEFTQRMNDAFKNNMNPVIGEISKLQDRVTASEANIGLLQTDITDEASTREEKIAEVRNQLAGMLDMANANLAKFEGKLEHLQHSFMGLEERCNNISTDDLYGRMVQWFLQTHPSNPAGVLDRLLSLQSEVRNLQQPNLGGLENRIVAIGAKANEAEKKGVEAQEASNAAWTELSNRVSNLEVARQGAESAESSAIIGPLIFSVGQVQAALHDIYQILPPKNGARRALEFTHDFSPRPPPESSHANNGQSIVRLR